MFLGILGGPRGRVARATFREIVRTSAATIVGARCGRGGRAGGRCVGVTCNVFNTVLTKVILFFVRGCEEGHGRGRRGGRG